MSAFPSQVAPWNCLWAWIIALITIIGFFSTVYPHMSHQMSCIRSWEIALITFVGLLASVNSNVSFKMSCFSCWKIALVTFLLFLSTVYLNVFFQEILPKLMIMSIGCSCGVWCQIWLFLSSSPPLLSSSPFLLSCFGSVQQMTEEISNKKRKYWMKINNSSSWVLW